MKVELLISDVYVGLKVIDNDDFTGLVTSCSDIHNVYVDYGDGGSGLYCLDKNCENYDPLFKVE